MQRRTDDATVNACYFNTTNEYEKEECTGTEKDHRQCGMMTCLSEHPVYMNQHANQLPMGNNNLPIHVHIKNSI